MIDFNNLPTNIDKQVFYAIDGVTWQTWTKPSKCSVAYMLIMGGGGAGGGGGSWNNTANSVLGGGGGAGSSITTLMVPFISIPDTLYILVGLGAKIGGTGANGGGSGTAGSAGGISYISLYPSTNMSDCLAVNSLTTTGGGSGGYNGSGVIYANGGVATGITPSTSTNPRYLSLCSWTSHVGPSGGAGTFFGAAGTPVTICGTLVTCAGSGGPGTGGNTVVSSAAAINGGDTLVPWLAGVPNGQDANRGANYLPFVSVGGPSGNQSTVLKGGNAGGYGSGGGGGAPQTNNGQAGNGGIGTDGIVIIVSY